MGKKIDDLDDVVEKITQKVVEKLMDLGCVPSETPTREKIAETVKESSKHGTYMFEKKGAASNIVDLGVARIGSRPGFGGKVDVALSGMIDHTLLKPDASKEELINWSTQGHREFMLRPAFFINLLKISLKQEDFSFILSYFSFYFMRREPNK